MKARPPHPAGRGFTIVELLVVVSIIVLLLSIIAPSLSRAVQQAEVAQCQSNLRQIGVGMSGFIDDHRMKLPSCWNSIVRGKSGGIGHWWHTDRNGETGIRPTDNYKGGTLWDYIRSEDVYVCPTFEGLFLESDHWGGGHSEAEKRVAYSYSVHESVGNHWQGLKLERYTDPYIRPGKMLFASDESPIVPISTTFNRGVPINNTNLGVSRNSNPGRTIDGVATYHLPDKSNLWAGNGNVLFMDGHAELTRQDEANDTKKLAYPPDFTWYDPDAGAGRPEP